MAMQCIYQDLRNESVVRLNLFARAYMQACRGALNDGGVECVQTAAATDSGSELMMKA